MLKVFLCFASADRAVAETIAGRLVRAAEVHVALDAIDDQTLHTAWEGGAASAGVVLLLSPASVKPGAGRDDWAGLLEHVEANAEPPILRVLVEACRFPRLLERSRFLRLDEQPDAALRAIQQWAISLHPSDSGGFAPASQPNFAGRATELERLRSSLVDQPGSIVITGAPRSGKTSLAQAFARQDQSFFRKVVWVSCRGRSQSCIVHDLANQLELKSPLPPEDSVAHLFDQHRLLAILDELEESDLVLNLCGGAASILVTRSTPLPGLPVLELEPASAATPEAPDSPEQQAFLEAMTVCRADEVPVELAAGIAEITLDRAVDVCRALALKSFIDPLDAAGKTYRLGWPATLTSARETELRRRHARLMLRSFGSHIAEAACAWRWSCEADWEVAVPLGRKLFEYFKADGRSSEVLAVLEQFASAAERQGDSAALEFARYELSWSSGFPQEYPGAAHPEQMSLF